VTDGTDPWLAELGKPAWGLVSGPVVNDDHLELDSGLTKGSRQRLRQSRPSVSGRNHDADLGPRTCRHGASVLRDRAGALGSPQGCLEGPKGGRNQHDSERGEYQHVVDPAVTSEQSIPEPIE
jgi:hypothetical protein